MSETENIVDKYLIVDIRCDNINEDSFATKEDAIEEIECEVDQNEHCYFRVVEIKVVKTYKLRKPNASQLVEA